MRTSDPKVMQRAFDKKFKSIAENIEEAYLEVGERGVGYLKKETPVDTGHLRQSMSYTVNKKVYHPLGNNDNVKPTTDKDTLYIGTNVIYAPHVEYRSKNGSQGFMLRAYNRTKKSAKQIFENAIKRGMMK